MADRIVVMNEGIIEQVGTPEDIYSRPANPFVADFVGTMNFLAGTAGNNGVVRLGDIELSTANGLNDMDEGSAITICIRPEDITTRGVTADTENAIPSVIDTLEFLGSFFRATLLARGSDGIEIRADFSINLIRDLNINEGQEFTIALPGDHIRVYGETFVHTEEPI